MTLCVALAAATNPAPAGTDPGGTIDAASPPLTAPGATSAASNTVAAAGAIGLLRQWRSDLSAQRAPFADGGGRPLPERLAVLHQVSDLVPPGGEAGGWAAQSAALSEQILGHQDRIESLLERIRTWEDNVQVNTGEGHAANTLMRAEAFAVERKYRRLLEQEVRAAAGLIRQWALVREMELADADRRLSRLMVLVSLQQAEAGADQETSPADLNSFEYYEVPEAATLREISARSQVYGDANLWSALQEANPAAAPDGDTVVAAGTLLVVPHQDAPRSFEF